MKIFEPANTWYNIENINDEVLKLYTIYAGPGHLTDTVHPTYQDAKSDQMNIKNAMINSRNWPAFISFVSMRL